MVIAERPEPVNEANHRPTSHSMREIAVVLCVRASAMATPHLIAAKPVASTATAIKAVFHVIHILLCLHGCCNLKPSPELTTLILLQSRSVHQVLKFHVGIMSSGEGTRGDCSALRPIFWRSSRALRRQESPPQTQRASIWPSRITSFRRPPLNPLAQQHYRVRRKKTNMCVDRVIFTVVHC